jgi:hypothetical protein
MVPTAASSAIVGSSVVLELAADILYCRIPMLYLKDYALQVKALDPSKTTDVDKVVADMAGYEDAIVTATLLSDGMLAPFEVLKSTQIYAISQQVGEDLYSMAFGDNNTFKSAQNRINTLPTQYWWVKVWDDALVAIDLLGAGMATYLEAPYLYYVGQAVADDSYSVVTSDGSITAPLSVLDAASLLVNGLSAFNGDGSTWYSAAQATDAIDSLLGDSLHLDGLSVGGTKGTGGDWSTFQPEAFVDAAGYPSPQRFTGDAIARMWMVYKGLDMSPLEKILASLHDLNPFTATTLT